MKENFKGISLADLCSWFGVSRQAYYQSKNGVEQDLIEQEIIDERAEIIGEIIALTTQESLESEIGKTFEVYVDGESEEHEYLLSARKTLWAPDIDGEIYINDNELSEGEQIKFGQIYTVKITELAGDKLLATVIK